MHQRKVENSIWRQVTCWNTIREPFLPREKLQHLLDLRNIETLKSLNNHLRAWETALAGLDDINIKTFANKVENNIDTTPLSISLYQVCFLLCRGHLLNRTLPVATTVQKTACSAIGCTEVKFDCTSTLNQHWILHKSLLWPTMINFKFLTLCQILWKPWEASKQYFFVCLFSS